MRAGRLLAGGFAAVVALVAVAPATANQDPFDPIGDVRAAIVNGEIVADPTGEFRTLRVVVDHGEGDPQICSAVAITERHALTAAHCFGPDTQAFDEHTQTVTGPPNLFA